jgi:hypothetical protein
MDFDELEPDRRREAEKWALGTDVSLARAVYSEADHNGVHTISFRSPGLFWLSRQHSALNAVEIKSAGGWGRILIMDAFQRWRFFMPSCFTGSFYFSPPGWIEGGMLIHVDCGDNTPPFLTLSWREKMLPAGDPWFADLSPSVEISEWRGSVVKYQGMGANL